MERTLWPSVVLLFCIFFLFEFTDLDILLQDHFYNFHKHRWLVGADARLPRLFFYTGPKLLIWLLGLSALCLAIFHRKFPSLKLSRRDLWIFIATLATAPLLVAASKATTNIFTPAQIRRYGGDAPYVKAMESYPANDRPARRGRGFPAGHASGGYALLASAGFASSRRSRYFCIAFGFGTGTVMGVYQMLKGAHYLSHTLITAILCWIIFLAYRKLFKTEFVVNHQEF